MPGDDVEHNTQVTAMLQSQDRSILIDFIAESREHLHGAETLFLELESDFTNTDHINGIFRSFHTIKGTAGFLDLGDVQKLAHAAESLLDKARNSAIVLNAGHIDLLLEVCDCLKFMLGGVEAAITGGEYCRGETMDGLMSRLSTPLSITSPQPTPPRLGDILVQQKVVSKQDVSECLNIQAHGDPRKLGEILIAEKNVPVREVAAAIASQNTLKGMSSGDESVRVSVEKLDQIIDIIGEALITQSMINANPVVLDANNQELTRSVSQMNVIMRQAQEMSMSMRMVPIKATFQKMARLVRDLSKKCGKNVELITLGEDTELDKSAVELVADPLMHMVRNSIDHGIEDSPRDRAELGKPAKAKIVLRAYHQGGNVCIEIADDGRGLDSKAILQKALEKKLAQPDVSYEDNEIYKFIFLPGFSTAKVITDVSGRGVGMDVVRKNIQALRGAIDIKSEYGKGATFTLRLPLTLSIISGMIVRTNLERYIIPTLSIIETLLPSNDQRATVLGKGEVLNIRGQLLPLRRLSDVLSVDAGIRKDDKEIVIIVEDMSGQRLALCVDEIIDQQQVVIKNIGSGIGAIPGISGAAIMSDGRVNLILDISKIISMTIE